MEKLTPPFQGHLFEGFSPLLVPEHRVIGTPVAVSRGLEALSKPVEAGDWPLLGLVRPSEPRESTLRPHLSHAQRASWGQMSRWAGGGGCGLGVLSRPDGRYPGSRRGTGTNGSPGGKLPSGNRMSLRPAFRASAAARNPSENVR